MGEQNSEVFKEELDFSTGELDGILENPPDVMVETQPEIELVDGGVSAPAEEKKEEKIVVDKELEEKVKEQIKKEQEASKGSQMGAGTGEEIFSDEEEPITLSTEELGKILEDTEEVPEIVATSAPAGETTSSAPVISTPQEESLSAIESEVATTSAVVSAPEESLSAPQSPESIEEVGLEELGEKLEEPEFEEEGFPELTADEIMGEEEFSDLSVPDIEESVTLSEKQKELEIPEGTEISLSEPVETEVSAPVEEKAEAVTSAPVESSSFFEEGEEEPITLSDEELEHIFETAEVVEEPAEVSAPSASVPEISLPEVSAPAEKITTEEVPVEEKPEPVMAPVNELDIDINKLRTILKYLDDLFEFLPEDKVKEFAESEYYDIYEEILDKLGI